ncbi:MAG: ATP-binding protein [Eubacterium sp.]|nr:ATP-binding protein [Eubacterium sp.]
MNTSVSYSNDQLRKMFDRFYGGSEVKERGFGIGLYVASLIVRRHKGKINARMQDDKHICFNVFLGCV